MFVDLSNRVKRKIITITKGGVRFIILKTFTNLKSTRMSQKILNIVSVLKHSVQKYLLRTIVLRNY